MGNAMRLVRILLLLLVATAVLGLTVALATADTGLVEKVVLLGLISMCVYVAARIHTLMANLEARLHRS